MTWRTLLSISRPRFWVYLAGPFAVGYAAGMSQPASLLSWSFLGLLLYFLGPANFFLYGINDLADGDTDRFNPKKGSREHKLATDESQPLIFWLLLHVMLTAGVGLVTGHWLSAGLLFGILGLSFAYSHPPFRWKAQPIIDSASNFLYILPGVFGYFWVTQTLPPWWIWVAGGAWTAAMHLFSAIPDIEADAKADLFTTAVTFGRSGSLLLCSGLWCVTALVLTWMSPSWFTWLMWLYPLLPLLVLSRRWNISQVYWSFPYLNAVIGFIGFWVILWHRFGSAIFGSGQ